MVTGNGMTRATDAYWLEQTEHDVPASDRWLSTAERRHLAALRFDKRRRDWRLGRWTAKRAMASCLNLSIDVESLQDIELRAAPSGAPSVFLFNQPAGVSVSISHRAGKALCVVGLSGASVGCDLEMIEPREQSFVAEFFTANEQQLVGRAPADQQPLLTTLLWSAKESTLKALQIGLRAATTFLDVEPAGANPEGTDDTHRDACVAWSPLLVRCKGGRILYGWWRYADNMTRTVIFNPS